MPIGNGRGIAATGKPLSNMARLKRSILKLTLKKLAYGLVIAIAKLTNDPNYVA
jgi:hypothetical protein